MTGEHGPGDFPDDGGLPDDHPLKGLEGGFHIGGEGLSLGAFAGNLPTDESELDEPITMDTGEYDGNSN